MKKIIIFIIRGVIPLFFLGWILYFTGKIFYEYIYYKRIASKIEREILYLKAKTAVREAQIAFLKSEKGQKIFLKKVYEDIEKH